MGSICFKNDLPSTKDCISHLSLISEVEVIVVTAANILVKEVPPSLRVLEPQLDT